MALIKAIELPNGITINYHRVVSITNITNCESVIEIAGYTSKAKRDEEKRALQNNEEMNIFIQTDRTSVPYNPNFDVIGAYEYLKQLDEFSGAEDD